jgi:uncharacterized protein YdaL
LHLKQIAAVTALASAALLLAATPANAAVGDWNGDVSSDGAVTLFNTQRTASQQVENAVWKTADAGIALIACDNLSVVSGEWHMKPGEYYTFGATTNRCFRQQIRRWYPQDTNGILPGWGVTSLNGTIKW